MPSPTKNGSTLRFLPASFLVGFLGLGVGAGVWREAFLESFGPTPAVQITFLTLALVSLSLGASSWRGVPPSMIGAAVRFATLGAAAFLAPTLAELAAQAFRASGISLESGGLATTFGRIFTGGLLVVAMGLGAAAVVRSAVAVLPTGHAGSRWATAIVAAIAGGVSSTLGLNVLGTPAFVPAALAAALLWGSAALLLILGRRAALGRITAPRSTERVLSSPALAAAGVGFAVAAAGFLAPRAYQYAFTKDLLDMPLVAALFSTAFTLGATSAVFLSRIRSWARESVASASLLAAGTMSIWALASYDQIPARFVDVVESAERFPDVVRAAIALAGGAVVPLGLLLGIGSGLAFGSFPGNADGRPAHLSRIAWAAAAGGILGGALARLPIPAWEVTGAIRGCSLIAVVLAAASLVHTRERLVSRAAIALIGLVLSATIVWRLPDAERIQLLVDRNLRSATSLSERVQKSWRVFDEDDAANSIAILQRGHVRRLFVDGRFEMSNETNHGALAHLPLLIHPAPSKVLVLGSGNGASLDAVSSYAVERIECLAPSRGFVKATARSGPRAIMALRDPRLGVRVGDPLELLERANESFDVVINELCASHSVRSARICTREAFEAVRERLEPGGIYCHWTPGSTLTKTGFQILLKTLAEVFPQVEVWSGHGSDTLLLAKKTRSPHDFDAILSDYGRVEVAQAARRAWIAEPITLLSHFLISDDTVRRIAARSPVHSRESPQLGRDEIRRRFAEPVVDPVPGLAGIRSDVLTVFANIPSDGFAEAVSRAFRARDLEREGFAHEHDGTQFDAIETIALRDDERRNHRNGG